MTDRGSWPSASAAAANRLCKARHRMQLGLPEPARDPDAESGSAIHAAWCGKPTRQLTDDEQETLERFDELEIKILSNWMPEWKSSKPIGRREIRLWYRFHSERLNLDLETSGQSDVIYVQGNRALIIDGKRGRKSVTNERENLQLRHLAALAAVNYSLEEVTVALAQHWSKNNPPCVYSITDLALAITELEEDVENDYDTSFQPVAGPEQCEYCKAKQICPAFLAGGLPVPFEPMPRALHIAETIAALSGTKLGDFLRLVRMASDVATSVTRGRLAAGETVDGWQLSPGRETETISDPTACYNRFLKRGGTPEQFLAAVKVGKAKLKDGLKLATGAKGKHLDKELETLLEGITESKTSQPVLEAK